MNFDVTEITNCINIRVVMNYNVNYTKPPLFSFISKVYPVCCPSYVEPLISYLLVDIHSSY